MVRTMRNNFQGKPTDTPVWEKNGWTGDANVACESMCCNFDVSLFLSKFLDDLADAQDSSGTVPQIAPTANWAMDNTPVWNGILILAAEKLLVSIRQPSTGAAALCRHATADGPHSVPN